MFCCFAICRTKIRLRVQSVILMYRPTRSSAYSFQTTVVLWVVGSNPVRVTWMLIGSWILPRGGRAVYPVGNDGATKPSELHPLHICNIEGAVQMAYWTTQVSQFHMFLGRVGARVCRDKSKLVATNTCLSFVATKMILYGSSSQ